MIIKNKEQLAAKLNMPIKKLTYLLYVMKIENCYTSFNIPKKNCSERKISSPIKPLKIIQRKLADLLYFEQQKIWETNKINPKLSHGFEKNKNIITNAEIHRNKRFILNIDLENFFDSIHFGRVRGYFNKNRNFKLPIDVATIIAQLTCYNGSLPQGAPSSPIITNLMCQVLDIKLSRLAKTYKLHYTRYADDITFSTNNKIFLDQKNVFMNELISIIDTEGFKINTNKTRLQFKDSQQSVTGLVVNKKVNIDNEYFKTTKAMAHSQYMNGKFFIGNEEGNINQLEGRFSFIDQLDKFNNIKNKLNKKTSVTFNRREAEYQKFLVYKNFLHNSKPLIITEGKTDQLYIKAALKKYYQAYPQLIEKKGSKFYYKFSFFKRTAKLKYFLNLAYDGADTLTNIFLIYKGKDQYHKFSKFFSKYKFKYTNPIILLFDNEQKTKKPLYKFLQEINLNDTQRTEFDKFLYLKIISDYNLYLQTIPLCGLDESEMEDLLDQSVLDTVINNRTFSKKVEKGDSDHYSKDVLAKYVYENYNKIDFSNFTGLIDSLQNILKIYAKSND